MTDLDDRAELVAALEALEASASKVRRLLQEATGRHGYRATAEMSGLAVPTIQRWRFDVPPSPTLRTAEARRGGEGCHVVGAPPC